MAFAVDWPFPESESPENNAVARLAREFMVSNKIVELLLFLNDFFCYK